ncbi:uncharacterized protein IUM83_12516 [Phytophthora cinnamomi]|uniref:uncharacterized protein n=1 Tax=Phytophthora cinnamomi TaxID=4785 RepID=UPI003559D57B|nr:hypothetical protein IUM83_12516 [Phytophthora cinnamomi]
MCFYRRKSKSQTVGSPNYAPQTSETQFLNLRWSAELYTAILPLNKRGKSVKAKLPWNRIAAVMAGLSRYVDFMEANCQAWWDLLHWIMIDVEQEGKSKDLYDKRRVRTDSLIRKYKTEVTRLRRIPRFPESLFQEPGLWPLPQRACYWICLLDGFQARVHLAGYILGAAGAVGVGAAVLGSRRGQVFLHASVKLRLVQLSLPRKELRSSTCCGVMLALEGLSDPCFQVFSLHWAAVRLARKSRFGFADTLLRLKKLQMFRRQSALG